MFSVHSAFCSQCIRCGRQPCDPCVLLQPAYFSLHPSLYLPMCYSQHLLTLSLFPYLYPCVFPCTLTSLDCYPLPCDSFIPALDGTCSFPVCIQHVRCVLPVPDLKDLYDPLSVSASYLLLTLIHTLSTSCFSDPLCTLTCNQLPGNPTDSVHLHLFPDPLFVHYCLLGLLPTVR